MVTLTSFEALQQRHIERFDKMRNRMESEAHQIRQDLKDTLVELHSGSPQGAERTKALRREAPFARWQVAPVWATPPIGVITGALRDSLYVDYDFDGDSYTLTGKSFGVDYAEFIWSKDGTSKMLPRKVRETVEIWAEARMIDAGWNLMRFQLSLL